jgi:hypothetical protein
VILDKSIAAIIENFHTTGKLFGDGKRNKIKLFNIDGKTINVKSFKIPGILNGIVYRYFRQSKAKRSFEYAQYLISKNVGTPLPISFFENKSGFTLKESYYISEHLDFDLMFRDLVESKYPDAENILRQFTRFCFHMHEQGIEFLDHSPGNTLIKKEEEGQYLFYLVDLNRMKFHENIDFETRMKNLSRLTPDKEMVRVMSNEYAKMYEQNENTIFITLWGYTERFQEHYYRKKRMKKILKFWKK